MTRVRRRCLLLVPQKHRLTGPAIVACAQHYHVTFGDRLSDDEIAKSKVSLLISFLSERILPEQCLLHPNLNFHPAPPQYPGRGGASYALFDGATEYGATAHVMSKRVDAGSIVLTRRFAITQSDGCADLFERAEDACLSMLEDIMSSDVIPPPNGEVWAGPARTRKQFDDWLELDHTDPAFSRKVKAAAHPRFPGPYVILDGHKFGLVQ